MRHHLDQKPRRGRSTRLLTPATALSHFGIGRWAGGLLYRIAAPRQFGIHPMGNEDDLVQFERRDAWPVSIVREILINKADIQDG